MNQKYASDCAYYVFYLVVKFNLLVKCHHYCHYYASAVPHICHLQPGLQCQRPLEICFKIRQQLFIELCYNSAAKTQNLQFYSVRVIAIIIKAFVFKESEGFDNKHFFFSTFIPFYSLSCYSQDGHPPFSFPNGVLYRI